MITLPIKKKWFDMILSGEKKEEYRDYTQYYMDRLAPYLQTPVKIRLRNGYRKDSPALECTVVPRIGKGREDWGAPKGWNGFVLAIQGNPELIGGDNNV